MTFAEILDELRKFEHMKFSSDPEAQETCVQMTYDALVSLLNKLSE
jgi:hypothetical protein